MSAKDQARSIAARLTKIALERGVSYTNVLTEFLIERLVIRLTSVPKLQNCLIFKGGYVGLKIYNSTRYTVDLDALLRSAKQGDALPLIKKAAESEYSDGIWFRFESEIDLKTQGEYGGIRLVFRAGLGEVLKNIQRAQIVHFDMGMGDPVTPEPITINTPDLLGEQALSWQVYPIETAIAEKLEALVQKGGENSRSKDVFDLYNFLPQADSELLSQAILKTFKYRGTPLPKNIPTFVRAIDTSILKRGWASATRSVKTAPDFDTVYQGLIEQLVRIIG